MESLWTWLSTPPAKGEVLDALGVFSILLFAPGFVVSAYFAGSGAGRLAKDAVQVAGIRYCASIGLWVFGAGPFFFGARIMQINPLSFGEPKWLVGSIAVVILAGARCVEWWRTDYPAELERRVSADTVYPLSDLASRVSGAPARPQKMPEAIVRK
jgi:hypothetical protein